MRLSRPSIERAAAVLVVALLPLSFAAAARAQLGGFTWRVPRAPAYPLDSVPRRESGREVCQPEGLVRYRGEAVRLDGSALVHPAFAERLERFEVVLARVATAAYGRAPYRIEHVGGYVCRAVRGRRSRISEHALGNALDVRGFRFRAISRRDAPEDLPRSLRRGFTVRVGTHWSPRRERDQAHADFLHRLIAELVREDVFRVIYGPAHRGHHDHFHFDMSPFRWVHV